MFYVKDDKFENEMKVSSQIFLVNKIEFSDALECSSIIEHMLSIERLLVGVQES